MCFIRKQKCFYDFFGTIRQIAYVLQKEKFCLAYNGVKNVLQSFQTLVIGEHCTMYRMYGEEPWLMVSHLREKLWQILSFYILSKFHWYSQLHEFPVKHNWINVTFAITDPDSNFKPTVYVYQLCDFTEGKLSEAYIELQMKALVLYWMAYELLQSHSLQHGKHLFWKIFGALLLCSHRLSWR